MSSDERSSIDNGIWLCQNCSKLIDSDEDRFTVLLLRSWKVLSEEKTRIELQTSPSKQQEKSKNLSNVTSINQSGGQTAHTIINNGTPQREIGHETRIKMLEILDSPHRGTIGFASTQGDKEAHAFKVKLMHVFSEAGWSVVDKFTFMFFGRQTGLVLTIPFDAPDQGAPQIAVHALTQTGQQVSCNRGDMANNCRLYIQVWYAG